MDIEAYFRSISQELESQRDRVRQFLGDRHWPTDGAWKESVLRAVLRRMVGSGVEIGSGFFLAGEVVSPQIDLLIYRSDSPVLFRDGDLVIVPAHAVRAVIEVKTRLRNHTLSEGLTHLTRACGNLRGLRRNVMTGLFAHESDYRTNGEILRRLRRLCSTDPVDVIANGPDRFVRYWANEPGTTSVYEQWHSYEMAGLAFGYFIQNLVSHMAPDGIRVSGAPFYPRGGKERHLDGRVRRAGSIMELFEELDHQTGSISKAPS